MKGNHQGDGCNQKESGEPTSKVNSMQAENYKINDLLERSILYESTKMPKRHYNMYHVAMEPISPAPKPLLSNTSWSLGSQRLLTPCIEPGATPSPAGSGTLLPTTYSISTAK
jgi:hypothetical protein